MSCGPSNPQPVDPVVEDEFTEPEMEAPISFDLDSIKNRGVLRAIVVSGPTSFFIYKGETMGYEYEMLTRFADHLGVKLEIVVASSFSELGELLNSGEGDVIAHGLTVTQNRQKYFAFSDYLYLTHQVLVQRKPTGWRKLKQHQIDRALIHDPIELIGDTVSIRNNSSYMSRLVNTMSEVGGDIYIDTASAELSTDQLIAMVESGEIKYTIADNTLAEINANHYPDLNVKTRMSFSQRASWVVRLTSPKLQEALNEWIGAMKNKTEYYVIFNKYYKNKRSFNRHLESDYYLNETGVLSPYDDWIKEYSETLPWDWKLLASQVYQESRFDPHAKSWASAHGLMQLMPATARELGVKNTADPEQSIDAGTRYLKKLWNMWSEIPDSVERIKFTLASYNAGFYHVQDARTLAELTDRDPFVWDDNVELCMLDLTYQKNYSRPEIKYGYVRGREPVAYVEDIMDRYKVYTNFLEN
jgi:membrane-bound lytic murein transglycosylase F